LVEIVVAIALLVFAAAGIIQFFLSSLGLSETSKEETIAMNHLINMMEAVKCTPPGSITSDFPNGVANGPAGNNYATLVGGYALTGEQIIVSYANASSNPLEIIAGLSWQDRRGVNRTKYLVIKKAR